MKESLQSQTARVLEYLKSKPNQEATPAEIGDDTGLGRASISGPLVELETAGLIESYYREGDKQRVIKPNDQTRRGTPSARGEAEPAKEKKR